MIRHIPIGPVLGLLLISLVIRRGFADQADDLVIHWNDRTPEAVHPITTRNGRRMFVRELYSLRRPEDFRIAQFLGFNAVIGHGPNTFRYAENAGFYVTEASWYTRGFAEESARKEARAFREEPSLIAYNLMDEADLYMHKSPPEVMERATRLIRQEDSDARISITLAGSGRARSYWPDFAKYVDVFRVDPYPLVSRKPLFLVKDMVEDAREAAGPDRYVITILQAWYWHSGYYSTNCHK